MASRENAKKDYKKGDRVVFVPNAEGWGDGEFKNKPLYGTVVDPAPSYAGHTISEIKWDTDVHPNHGRRSDMPFFLFKPAENVDGARQTLSTRLHWNSPRVKGDRARAVVSGSIVNGTFKVGCQNLDLAVTMNNSEKFAVEDGKATVTGVVEWDGQNWKSRNGDQTWTNIDLFDYAGSVTLISRVVEEKKNKVSLKPGFYTNDGDFTKGAFLVRKDGLLMRLDRNLHGMPHGPLEESVRLRRGADLGWISGNPQENLDFVEVKGVKAVNVQKMYKHEFTLS